ncbi:MAG: class I SAM-dependent DNA methyltransferase [Methanomassiliicoccales archaeon]|nr:class I SAM-dependent DNA methyltransferase [Methanomassiliicoccales archaeon]
MPISLNEIRSRAYAFANEHKYDTDEEAEAKTFWDEFFNIFGVSRRRVATFEKRVHKVDGKDGYIDLLWKGVILIEHKSKGKDLDRAYKQATDYFPGLSDSDLPKYIMVSDFARFRLYNLDDGTQNEFWLVDLPQNIHLFDFMSGHQKQLYPPQDPVNIKAAELMGKLHDQLKDVGYAGHDLEVYLVRLLFCLFADDTGIFEKNAFREYIERNTKQDGSDLAYHLGALFEVLDTPEDGRLKNLDESLKTFCYVNGSLFQERLRTASFDSAMRRQLLDCAALDWSRISPAIFGSLFQSVMNPDERRALGAHYTEETNILKVINPLFLDELKEELQKARGNARKLDALHDKLSKLKFLDPACGCGNFLVIAYRELRLIEIEILKEKNGKEQVQQVLDISHLSRINVDQFYGIEIEEFPAQIAQVALWLMDHQMNMLLSSTFGQYYARLPLKTKPNIYCENALKKDWKEIAPPDELSYILGNPPFVGSRFLSNDQRKEIDGIFNSSKNSGVLDYVTAWYVKAAQFIEETKIKVGFVSTNSITQGEQVGPLWDVLLNKFGVKIHFAHRTFRWSSQARGRAAVHCVIIGFATVEPKKPVIFDYDTPEAEAHRIDVEHINPYLVNAPNILIENRTKPISDVPRMLSGCQPIDNGNFLFSESEMNQFINIEPNASKWMKPFVGSIEFINGYSRYCLFLRNCPPEELRSMSNVMKRVDAVKQFRLSSKRKSTLKMAVYPTRFGLEIVPETNFVVVPKVSSERRKYIPIGFLSPDTICSDLVYIIPNGSLYHLGVITSTMHMAWVRYVCGRLKSDYRYSVGIVYNNFPWPDPTEKQKVAIEKAAQGVLDARALFPKSSLADLYDPLTMPKELVKAHQDLDAEVEKAYGKRFASDADRVAFLFGEYLKLTGAAP